MPRVNICKTREQINQERMELHKKKVLDSIRLQMAEKDISKKELSEITAIDYQRLCRLLRGFIQIDIWTMTQIANALDFTQEQRAAMVSGKTTM